MILSYDDMIKIKNKYALLFNMKRFIHYNPLFGRRFKCVHFRKLYYISVLHHQYNNTFYNTYIPKPSLFNIHKRTFFISEFKNNIYSFFPNVDFMNLNTIPEITNTIDIIKFARTYIFNAEQNEIIQKHIVHKFNELTTNNILQSNTKYNFTYNNIPTVYNNLSDQINIFRTLNNVPETETDQNMFSDDEGDLEEPYDDEEEGEDEREEEDEGEEEDDDEEEEEEEDEPT